MKILFAGPSIRGIEAAALAGVHCRGPARQGDILRAVLDGATAIGLVDGLFGDVASVWHKEILFALDQGVTLMGAASLGALRAAECAAFGMIGIGEIYRGYATGVLEDDDAVAQLHAPAELGFEPLTEALVNVEATLVEIRAKALLDAKRVARLSDAASRLFFEDRTYDRIIAQAGLSGAEDGPRLIDLLRANHVDLKRRDASLLLARMVEEPDRRGPKPDWQLSQTRIWRRILADHRAAAEPASAPIPPP